MTDFTPSHFHDEEIQVRFNEPPVREKAPHCPDGFQWKGREYIVSASLAEWTDFTRHGNMARNMRPAHAASAATRGSLNVGRYYFRAQVNTGQVFDIYYDRAIKSVDARKGQWFLYREMEQTHATTSTG